MHLNKNYYLKYSTIIYKNPCIHGNLLVKTILLSKVEGLEKHASDGQVDRSSEIVGFERQGHTVLIERDNQHEVCPFSPLEGSRSNSIVMLGIHRFLLMFFLSQFSYFQNLIGRRDTCILCPRLGAE